MSLFASINRVSHLARRLPTTTARYLGGTPAPATSIEKEKRYVRIAGPASYSSKEDVALFLTEHGVPLQHGKASLVQGQSDIFQNHSIWMMETATQQDAVDVAARVTGRVLGLKLIRAAAVDQKLYDNLMSMPEQKSKTTSLRKRMSVIAPTVDERGRAILVRNIPFHLPVRALWSFFAAYDVLGVRHLRRSGVACVVFASEDEAWRALRERKNVRLQRQFAIALKMHE